MSPMVRNEQLPPNGMATQLIAHEIQAMTTENNLTQKQVGTIIHRAQSYASLRLKGLKPWTIEELDLLARPLGHTDFFSLLDAVRERLGAYGIRRPQQATAISPAIGTSDAVLTDDDRRRLILEKLHHGGLGLAANIDPYKRDEMEGGDGR